VADTFGCALAESGMLDEAVTVLQRAVQLSPSVGFEKYMYLGQILDPERAMLCVRAGLKILQHHLPSDPELNAPLAAALCTLVELLLNSGKEVRRPPSPSVSRHTPAARSC
jgi:hypothetical protein